MGHRRTWKDIQDIAGLGRVCRTWRDMQDIAGFVGVAGFTGGVVCHGAF